MDSEPAARLRVTVTCLGKPLPGAEVVVLPITDEVVRAAEDPLCLPRQAFQDAWRGVADALGQVDVERPERRLCVCARGAGAAPSGILVEAGTDAATLDLPEECRAFGSVMLSTGVPAAGAVVRGRKAMPADWQYLGLRLDPRRLVGVFFDEQTTVDASGHYELRGLPQQFVRLEASLAGWSTAMADYRELPYESEYHCVLYQSARVTGRVVDAGSQAPLADALVSAVRIDPIGFSIDPLQEVLTDAQGSFELDGIRADGSEVLIVAERGGHAQERATLRNLAPGDRRTADFALQPGSALHGVVRTTDGLPASYVYVRAFDESTQDLITACGADAEGRFTVAGLRPGSRYALVVTRRGSPTMQRVEGIEVPREDPLEVVLTTYSRVVGRAVVNGEPVPSGLARLATFEETGSISEDRYVYLAGDGSFLFEQVARGSHRVEVYVDGYAPTRVDPLRVDPPHTDGRVLEIELTRGAELSGRVLLADGVTPVPGAKIMIADIARWGGNPTLVPRDAVADEQGNYRIPHAGVGFPYVLIVDHAPSAVTLVPVTLAEGTSAASVDLILQAGASLAVKVHTSGVPEPNFVATLSGKGRVPEVLNAVAGVAHFERLMSGTARMEVSLRDPSQQVSVDVRHARQVEIVEGANEVVFQFGRCRLTGTIGGAALAGQPRQMQVVADLESTPPEYASRLADPSLTYALTHLAAGRYKVRCFAVDPGPRFEQTRSVELHEDEVQVLDFDFGAAGVRGRVVDESGAPVVSALLWVRTPDAAQTRSGTVQTDGSVEVPALDAPQRWDWMCEAAGFGRERGTLELATADSVAELTVTLHPEARIVVDVRDRAGSRVANVVARAVADGPAHAIAKLAAASLDDAGRHVFRGASNGAYRVSVTADGYVPWERVVTARAGEVSEVACVLRRPAALRVRLLRVDGSPLTDSVPTLIDREGGADVAAWLKDGTVTLDPATGTDAAGWIRFTGLAEGAYRVTALGQTRDVEVAVGDEPARLVLQEL